MKSPARGKNISEVEISNISSNGIWMIILDFEYFMSFKDFPWFKEASISEIQNVKLSHGHHLYWPDLDVDLELDSLKSPDKYPLKYIA